MQISGFQCNEDGNEAHITSLTTGRFVFLNFLHGVSCYLIPLVFQECSTVQAISNKIWNDNKTKNWWRLIIIVRWFQQIPVFSGFRFKIDPNVDMTPLDFKDWNWCSSLRRLYHCKGATNPMSSKKQRNARTYAASKLPFFVKKPKTSKTSHVTKMRKIPFELQNYFDD